MELVFEKVTGKMEVAVFGGGCFWCTEAIFRRLKGVEKVSPGYAGGEMPNPTYIQVSLGKTRHAEVVRIEFEPAVISYRDLLTVFFATHDPTTPNRQGADAGTQYRSIILYTSEAQKQQAEKFIKELNQEGMPAVTEIKPLGDFYEAEESHREYYEHNRGAPYCQIVINPKLEKLEKEFRELLK